MKKQTWYIIGIIAIILLMVIFWPNIRNVFSGSKSTGLKVNDPCTTTDGEPGIWNGQACSGFRPI